MAQRDAALQGDLLAAGSKINTDIEQGIQVVTLNIGGRNTNPLEFLLEGDDSGEKFVLFQMTVELGEGRSGAIRVHAGDEPSAVASAFCAEHALPAMYAEPLAASIASSR